MLALIGKIVSLCAAFFIFQNTVIVYKNGGLIGYNSSTNEFRLLEFYPSNKLTVWNRKQEGFAFMKRDESYELNDMAMSHVNPLFGFSRNTSYHIQYQIQETICTALATVVPVVNSIKVFAKDQIDTIWKVLQKSTALKVLGKRNKYLFFYEWTKKFFEILKKDTNMDIKHFAYLFLLSCAVWKIWQDSNYKMEEAYKALKLDSSIFLHNLEKTLVKAKEVQMPVEHTEEAHEVNNEAHNDGDLDFAGHGRDGNFDVENFTDDTSNGNETDPIVENNSTPQAPALTENGKNENTGNEAAICAAKI